MMTNDDEQGGGKKAKKLHTMKEGDQYNQKGWGSEHYTAPQMCLL